MSTSLNYHDNSQSYYGSVITSTADLKTSACCAAEAPPLWLRGAIKRLPEEILTKFYGCGSPLPLALDGCSVLDLGCGTGRDVYTAAQFVGSTGKVIGVDLTASQLEVANRYKENLCRTFDLPADAIRFAQGPLEDLAALGIEDASVDVVISNCVLNLCPDKRQVLGEIARVLKPGGELYFSDVFASRRLPDGLRNDPVFHGECLGGAWYWEDFRRFLAELQIPDYRVMSQSVLEIEDQTMAAQTEGIGFDSATIRAFKISSMEDRCEDYGQIVTYKGTLAECPRVFELDPGHRFEVGRPVSVCGNSAAMIEETRFSKHFEVQGDRGVHYGLFEQEEAEPVKAPTNSGCC
ncbi:MAG: arsenite methyltransferase [Verrucomicrobiales bacterium]|jgi:arsenite methyltransferase